MGVTITVFQIIIATLLIITIILQQRGTSLGTAFGGGGETYRSKRGLEKMLFYMTIILAILFAASSILSLVLR
jgi:preprotein translocase subunit SecG